MPAGNLDTMDPFSCADSELAEEIGENAAVCAFFDRKMV
jgi:hypothetical protein